MSVTYSSLRRLAALLTATAVVAGACLSVEAATPFLPARLKEDGKTPDFRGIWQARGTAYVNIEGHAAVNAVRASTSIIVDPPDGKIPYKPEALARRQVIDGQKVDVWILCVDFPHPTHALFDLRQRADPLQHRLPRARRQFL